MGRHREMVGSSYQVLHQGSTSAEVRCNYLCPYCDQMTWANLAAYPSDYNLLDTEGFFDNLICSLCGKVSKVSFIPSQRI